MPPSPSLLPSPLPLLSSSLSPLLAMPAKPIFINKVNKDKNKNIKKPIKVEYKDIGLLLLLPPPPPIYFISV